MNALAGSVFIRIRPDQFNFSKHGFFKNFQGQLVGKKKQKKNWFYNNGIELRVKI